MNTLRHWSPLAVILIAIVLQPALLPARTVLEAGHATVWKYLDDGVEPDAGWREVVYDDSDWKSGPAPLGFGEARIGTRVGVGQDERRRPITTYFRREFDGPALKLGERLAVLICVDDGAIIRLNDHEIARINMPEGPVGAATFARQTVGNDEEGFYHRLPVSAQRVRQNQKNVLAIEVHQASAISSDLFFDLALKVLPAVKGEAEVSPEAREVVELYHQRHYLGPDVRLPDGYIDGGRRMAIDTAGRAASRRELLMLDRTRDDELLADLAFARTTELRALPPLERAQRIVAHIDERTTPPGGPRWVFPTTARLELEFTNKPLLIGDWIDQCQAGVCRHRALLFKVLADEAGLRAALVRGNFAAAGPPGLAHAWNEIEIEDGRRVLVDVMRNGGQPKFPALTDPDVVAHYLKVDGMPWYGPPSGD